MRERGFAGVGIDAIVADAGLTAGAFYTHFSSKAALFAEVVQEALRQAEEHLPMIETEADADRFVGFYLSNRAVRELGAGCVVGAMSADLARDAGGARKAAAEYISLIHGRLESALRERLGDAASAEAWRMVSGLIGAVVVARILPPARASQALAAGRVRQRE